MSPEAFPVCSSVDITREVGATGVIQSKEGIDMAGIHTGQRRRTSLEDVLPAEAPSSTDVFTWQTSSSIAGRGHRRPVHGRICRGNGSRRRVQLLELKSACLQRNGRNRDQPRRRGWLGTGPVGPWCLALAARAVLAASCNPAKAGAHFPARSVHHRRKVAVSSPSRIWTSTGQRQEDQTDRQQADRQTGGLALGNGNVWLAGWLLAHTCCSRRTAVLCPSRRSSVWPGQRCKAYCWDGLGASPPCPPSTSHQTACAVFQLRPSFLLQSIPFLPLFVIID